MSTIDITLPAAQLEGTSAILSKWLVDIGQHVDQGEPVIELETDKVSMEICAEESGNITDFVAHEGEEICVDSVLGHIETTDSSNYQPKQTHEHNPLIGPAVRRLLTAHQLTLEEIKGSGRRGRVTRNDVMQYIAQHQQVLIAKQQKIPSPIVKPQENTNHHTLKPELTEHKSTMVKHSTMRKTIADHMVNSLLNTSPHVTSIFEMDMSNVIEHKKWHKKEYQQLDTHLTYTAYFLAALVKAIEKVPQVNARFHQDALEIFSDINIGVGTALGDDGIVVPVVSHVQNLSLFEIAQALNAQTDKARAAKLTPNDMKGGTFTISNHGVSGSLIATPIIINQPQVAIMGVGKLEKRVTVEEVDGVDTIIIKPKCYVSLSIDHRALDAHQTNLFLSAFVEEIENWGQ